MQRAWAEHLRQRAVAPQGAEAGMVRPMERNLRLSVSLHTLPAQVAAYAVSLHTPCLPKWPHMCTNNGGEFLYYGRDFLY